MVGDGRRSSTTLLSSIFNFNEVSTETRLIAYWESKSGRRWQEKDTPFHQRFNPRVRIDTHSSMFAKQVLHGYMQY